MIFISLLIAIMFAAPYTFKLYKRQSILKNTEVVSVYPRLKTQFNFRDLSNYILFIWIIYFGLYRNYQYGIEYSLMYSPLLLVIIINQFKRFDNISITKNYILFEMMHLHWKDVERVHVENNKTLVITSHKLMMGIIRIESIDNISEIEKEIRKITQ